ncbi:CUT domain containing protein [Aphelenchoides avenae]|nr:CUT domain containing protein [Aphelenchus avenae]
MEPPAVTSCSVGQSVASSQHGSSNVDKGRREVAVDFLQIDPRLSYNSSSRHFEELPENFLETISPQQSGQSSVSVNLSGHHDHGGNVASPQLASLTTMSVPGGADSGGYATLVPMPTSSHHYVSTLKMESVDHLNHSSQMHTGSPLEKTTFGNGAAGLLSPLQIDGNRDQSMGLLSVHRTNGRASDMLSNLRRPVSYIKEEIPGDIGFQGQEYEGFSMQQPTPQDLERANAETPPALCNVEMLSDLNEHQASPSATNATQFLHETPQAPAPRPAASRNRNGNRAKASEAKVEGDEDYPGTSRSVPSRVRPGTGAMGPGAGVPRAVYSTTDTTDPLNAEIDDDIYIDTKDLCKRVAYELKQHSIPQAIFAERILCQGTLSDLLRNPKPWNRLKSGRETFRRMYNWLQQPLHIRLSILDMYKGPMGSSSGVTPPPPAQNARHHTRPRNSGSDENGHPHPKRPRLVFTDIQKRTLQAIFKETQRPSREMQQTIAEHLRLDMSTVSNFFMNARRRSRNGTNTDDEPAPYQHVRSITPPPVSPPTRAAGSRSRQFKAQSSAQQMVQHHHIEETVAAVAGRVAAEYAHCDDGMPMGNEMGDANDMIVGHDAHMWRESTNDELLLDSSPRSTASTTTTTRTIPIENKVITVKPPPDGAYTQVPPLESQPPDAENAIPSETEDVNNAPTQPGSPSTPPQTDTPVPEGGEDAQ